MKKKDYIIITFFAMIFFVVLYQRKIAPMMGNSSRSGSGSGSGSASGNGQETKESSNPSGSAQGKNQTDPGKQSKNFLDGVFSEFEASIGMMDVKEDHDQEIKPPSGMSRTSYYVNGKFKSSYDGEKVPADLLTKKEFFTDPRKMKEDINFKMDKMSWDMENERNEFARTHDVRGVDRDAWIKLQDDHRKMRRKMWDENNKTWEELKRETYDTNGSELR